MLVMDYLSVIKKCVERYGDTVVLPFKWPTYFLNDPEDIRHILVTNHRNYVKARGLKLGRRFLGEGLLTSEAPKHTERRKLLQPSFHKEKIASLGRLMANTATSQVENRWQAGTVADISTELARVTLAVVTKALFSRDLSDETTNVQAALTICQHYIEHRVRFGWGLPEHWPTPMNRRYRNAIAVFHELIRTLILTRRNSGQTSSDLLSVLLEARDERGEPLTDNEIRDELVTMLLAGHETTANALSWAFFLLATNRNAEEQFHAEIDHVFGKGPIDVGKATGLRYTDAVFAESLRLYPPVWRIGRRAINADTLPGGLHLPPNAEIAMHLFVAHRNPKYFPDPERFLPERFLNGGQHTRPRFSYFPFGGGPRICIGEDFARLEAAIILGVIGQRFRLTLEPGQRIKADPLITLKPKYGIRMRIHGR
jgi:cytochrome P450